VQGDDQISRFLIAALLFFTIAAFLRLFGVLPTPGREPSTEFVANGIHISFASYDDLDGWRRGMQPEALSTFLRSCARIRRLEGTNKNNPIEMLGEPYGQVASLSGVARDWIGPCREGARLSEEDFRDPTEEGNRVRTFFEANFQPIKIQNRLKSNDQRSLEQIRAEGTFTGYFEPVYDASTKKNEIFSVPALKRPTDLVMADLGRFRKELAGKRIAGSVRNGVFVPYPDSAQINANALGRRARVIAWMRPNDLFFLQIQGSGRLRILGDREIRVGYDGQNGHAYTSIGKVLVDRGEMDLESVSMQSIRSWLDSAGVEKAQALRNENKSYVFFKTLRGLASDDLGPLGAEGVQLTPRRSLAVDRRYYGMGTPIWIEVDPDENGFGPQLRRLMIAQDTGGAIKGPVRADIFAGAGNEAALFSGGLNSQGRMYALIPNAVATRLADELE